jgi:hypothetical protein
MDSTPSTAADDTECEGIVRDVAGSARSLSSLVEAIEGSARGANGS